MTTASSDSGAGLERYREYLGLLARLQYFHDSVQLTPLVAALQAHAAHGA